MHVPSVLLSVESVVLARLEILLLETTEKGEREDGEEKKKAGMKGARLGF